MTKNHIYYNDFAYHFNFVKSTLSEGGPVVPGRSVYTVENQLSIARLWAGSRIDQAISFGYSPTILLVLAPLVFFPHATAYCLFNLFGLLSVWWQTHPKRSRLGIGILPFFSTPALHCFALGQTAILTGAGLLFLYEKTLAAGRATRRLPFLVPSVVLWALTAKPPLAVTAGAVLIGLRTWRPVALAVAMTVITTVMVWPLLGAGWWRDYLDLLAHYDKVSIAPAFAWSFHPELMANLHGVLNTDFGMAADLASRISMGIWLLVLLVLAACGPRLNLTAGGLWSLGVLSYLALCPHVSDTEEIQIVMLIPFCIPGGEERLRWQDKLVLAVVTLACFTSPIFSMFSEPNRMLLFSIKIALMIFIAVNYRLRREGAEEDAVMLLRH